MSFRVPLRFFYCGRRKNIYRNALHFSICLVKYLALYIRLQWGHVSFASRSLTKISSRFARYRSRRLAKTASLFFEYHSAVALCTRSGWASRYRACLSISVVMILCIHKIFLLVDRLHGLKFSKATSIGKVTSRTIADVVIVWFLLDLNTQLPPLVRSKDTVFPSYKSL